MNCLGVRSVGGAPLKAEDCPRTAVRFGTVCFAALLAAACQSAFRYSHIPSRPPSRPYPDSRYPPNPDAASKRFVQLIQTTPALIFGATSSARLIFSLQTLAASPYGVLFASATASSGVRNVIATS